MHSKRPRLEEETSIPPPRRLKRVPAPSPSKVDLCDLMSRVPLIEREAEMKKFFIQAKVEPGEAIKYEVKECGGGGNCFFHSVAEAVNTIAAPGSAPADAALIRKWAADALELEDVLSEERGETKTPSNLFTQKLFANFPKLVDIASPHERLKAMQDIILRVEPPVLYQGDAETAQLLTRPKSEFGKQHIGFIVFVLGYEGKHRQETGISCNNSLIRPDTRVLIPLLFIPFPGTNGNEGHWQLIFYKDSPIIDLARPDRSQNVVYRLPKSLAQLIIASCGYPDYLAGYGKWDLLFEDKTCDEWGRDARIPRSVWSEMPIDAKGIEGTSKVCNRIKTALSATSAPLLANLNRPDLQQLFAFKAISPVLGYADMIDLRIEPEPHTGKPWKFRSRTTGPLRIFDELGNLLASFTIPSFAGVYVQQGDAVLPGDLLAEWTCEQMDEVNVFEVARLLRLPNILFNKDICEMNRRKLSAILNRKGASTL